MRCLHRLGMSSAEVIAKFRRSIEFPGHVIWLPGGTQINGGRLGVLIPCAVGQALGKRAEYGEESWVITHCGDAGWISGQALNGFNIAHVHGSPITFVMHRNGIQHSGVVKHIMDLDPRRVLGALGIEILEVPSLHELACLYQAYREGFLLAQRGKPILIYPVGYPPSGEQTVTLRTFGEMYGLSEEVRNFARQHDVPLACEIWIPGSLMSFRDVTAMLQCLFLVNDLPVGESYHDGHMKGRKVEEVLRHPLCQMSEEHVESLEELRRRAPYQVVTCARPAPGTQNLVVPECMVAKVRLPRTGAAVTPRVGCEATYTLIAQTFLESFFVVSCDLDLSTRLAKAVATCPHWNNRSPCRSIGGAPRNLDTFRDHRGCDH